MWFRVVLMLLACVDLATLPVNSARILAVQTVCGKSHWNFMSGVLRALVEGGHTVTAFTPFPDGNQENYTEVDISRDMYCFREQNLKGAVANFSRPVSVIDLMVLLSREQCDTVYANDRMIELMRQNAATPFDLVFIEPLMSECVSYIATLLDVPVIYVIPLSVTSLMEHYNTGHFSNPAVVSHVLAAYGLPTTFVQRLTNTAIFAYELVTSKFTMSLVKRNNPRPYDLVPLYKPSLVFVNSHPVMSASSSIVTNVINVGGIHLNVAKSLPKDILEFIEQSPIGVIYFSFGSTTKMSSLPEHIKKAFLEVLAELPQRILMKYEEELEDKPKNIMTKKWLPQRDILRI
uniref:UDP-glucuronosyltransferase 2B17 n=1 Tax=Sipha flava TaxID=143950 RepID=A0A2S2QRA8_9HEMI